MKREMEISVILLNWNAAEDTIGCVRSLGGWQQPRLHIWVIDNASGGDDVARIRQACPEVQLIVNDRNLGFTGATNAGLQAALADDPTGERALLLLNNDARIPEESLRQLFLTLQTHPSAGIVGPLLYGDAERRKLIGAGSRNPVLHHRNPIETVLSDQPYAVDYISGSVALLRAALLREVGLLDDDYFFSTEVADLCERGRRQGYATLVDPAAWARHDVHRSSALRGTLYAYYVVRNRFLYARKFYPWLRWPLQASWAGYGWLLAGKLQLQRHPQHARAIRMAVSDGLSGRFGGQNERVLQALQQIAPSAYA